MLRFFLFTICNTSFTYYLVQLLISITLAIPVILRKEFYCIIHKNILIPILQNIDLAKKIELFIKKQKSKIFLQKMVLATNFDGVLASLVRV
jgi:hypothetical protein